MGEEKDGDLRVGLQTSCHPPPSIHAVGTGANHTTCLVGVTLTLIIEIFCRGILQLSSSALIMTS